MFPPPLDRPREALNRIVERLELAVVMADRKGDPMLVDLLHGTLCSAQEALSLMDAPIGTRNRNPVVTLLALKALDWTEDILEFMKDLFSDF